MLYADSNDTHVTSIKTNCDINLFITYVFGVCHVHQQFDVFLSWVHHTLIKCCFLLKVIIAMISSVPVALSTFQKVV